MYLTAIIGAVFAIVVWLLGCGVHGAGNVSAEAVVGSGETDPGTNLNPAVVIHDVSDGERQFRVVRDDLLPGGTKQRGMGWVAGIPETELVYAGPWNGYAQIAMAIAARAAGKRATMFATRDDYYTSLRAREYGCHIRVMRGSLAQLQQAARKYASRRSARLIEFGMQGQEFVDQLRTSIRQAVRGQLDTEAEHRFWLVGGSTTLLGVLRDLFPRSQFNVVQVGKRIWPDQLSDRTRLWVAPERFYDDARTPPPYPSAPTYDAKVWQFIHAEGKTGDIIWNVAG